MIVYALEQRWDILRHYFKNHDKKRSSISSVCSLSCKKVKETGILIDKRKREKPKTVHTPEKIAAVAESVSHCSILSN